MEQDENGKTEENEDEEDSESEEEEEGEEDEDEIVDEDFKQSVMTALGKAAAVNSDEDSDEEVMICINKRDEYQCNDRKVEEMCHIIVRG